MTLPDKQLHPGAGADLADEQTQPSGEFARDRLASVDEVPARPVGGNNGLLADSMIGKVLDNRYRIVQLLARGGMGRVYRAEQAPLNRIVALKVLDIGGEDAQDEEFRDRFIREAGACARLTHPNTIRIFDFGRTWDEVYYLAMEFLEGRNLHQVIRAEAPLAPPRVVHIATQMCGSLREAHRLGLIHRDLKPSNVMLIGRADEGEFVKVLDFGLVKELRSESELTRTDSVVGSPSYMSPEQIRAGKVDQRSDIYSLGVVMYACLTGKTPFSGVSTVNVLMAHLSNPPPPLREACAQHRGGPVLDWIVMTCLAKEPADRFASVEELRRALVLAAAEASGADVATPRLEQGRVVVDEQGWATPSGQTSPSLVARVARAPESGPGERSGVRSAVDADEPVEPVEVRPAPRRQAFPWMAALFLFGTGVAGVVLLFAWVLLRQGGGAPALPAQGQAPVPVSPPVNVSAPAPAVEVAAPPATTEAPPTEVERASPRSSTRPPRAAASAPPPASVAGPVAAPPVLSPPVVTPADVAPSAPSTAPPAAATPQKPPSDLRDPWKDR